MKPVLSMKTPGESMHFRQSRTLHRACSAGLALFLVVLQSSTAGAVDLSFTARTLTHFAGTVTDGNITSFEADDGDSYNVTSDVQGTESGGPATILPDSTTINTFFKTSSCTIAFMCIDDSPQDGNTTILSGATATYVGEFSSFFEPAGFSSYDGLIVTITMRTNSTVTGVLMDFNSGATLCSNLNNGFIVSSQGFVTQDGSLAVTCAPGIPWTNDLINNLVLTMTKSDVPIVTITAVRITIFYQIDLTGFSYRLGDFRNDDFPYGFYPFIKFEWECSDTSSDGVSLFLRWPDNTVDQISSGMCADTEYAPTDPCPGPGFSTILCEDMLLEIEGIEIADIEPGGSYTITMDMLVSINYQDYTSLAFMGNVVDIFWMILFACILAAILAVAWYVKEWRDV